MNYKYLASSAFTAASFSLLAACTGMQKASDSQNRSFNQDALPEAIKVPSGHQVALQTVGKGTITYECRSKTDVPNTHAWTFVGPQADLLSRGGDKLGTYFGPPATWVAIDGSKVTGAQLAVAPAAAGNIPLQLVKANAVSGTGEMVGVTYIQRLATQGGVAPNGVCDVTNLGKKEVVPYQADYIFWKAI